MKRFALVLALLFPVLGCGEEIQGYSVRAEIGEDGSVAVREEIVVYFDVARHGIYREIPISYRLPTGETYRLRVTVDEVLAEGEPVPYRKYTEGKNLVLQIGDPDRTVRGPIAYTIRYQLRRALRRYDGEIELYWNAIGTDWAMPIARARVEIAFPPEVAPTDVRAVGYRGAYGTTGQWELGWADGSLVGEAAGLRAGEGLTVAVRFPEGAVALPGAWQGFLWFLQDNLYAGIPILVLVGMFTLWWKRGRDPKVGSVAPEYKAIAGLGPAEAGVLLDNRVDSRDFAAGILSLATKGHIKIREIWTDESAREPDDFELVATESDAPLTPYEQALRDALLGGAGSRKLSDLKYKLYDKMPGLKTRLYMDLSEDGYYLGNPDHVRSAYYGIGIGTIVLAAFLGSLTQSLYLGLALGVSGLIVILFAPFMPKRTGKGIEALRSVLGLVEYIRRAEVDRIEFAAREKHFDELLPYAMALGLTELWTKKFDGLLAQPPQWYEGRFPTFAPYWFGRRLVALQHSAYSAATSAPRSTRSGGWSGGSGFGGRGFSGGGMGGGGGRSW
ncbi:MAG: DUF2207 domain-containing protein [Candidatus Bipolaricaulis anaerobius]|nr:DUF2207 domain-containing protein [Candidatus Bipolaricaulis anaerobius]